MTLVIIFTALGAPLFLALAGFGLSQVSKAIDRRAAAELEVAAQNRADSNRVVSELAKVSSQIRDHRTEFQTYSVEHDKLHRQLDHQMFR